MNIRIIILILVLMMIMISNVFAYHWVQSDTDWYVLSEYSSVYLKELLIDVGDNVYYLDNEGKLISDWCGNPTTEKILRILCRYGNKIKFGGC